MKLDINIKRKLEDYRRVLQIAKKPSREDYIDTARICAIGLVIIGVMGFLMYLISVSVPGGL
jgi:protein transport protein SEC61 subunit gamma-like protein